MIARCYLFLMALMLGGLLAAMSHHAFAEPIVTESTSEVTTNGSMTTTVKSPPPSAISPQFSSGNNNDLCTVGASGAVQTQILGLSFGSTVRDVSCERIRLSKQLADVGMKVAAVSVLCDDPRVWRSMYRSGTPCPAGFGLIGEEARNYWDSNPEEGHFTEKGEEPNAEDKRNMALGILSGVFGAALLF